MPYLGKQPATISAVAVDTTTGTFSGQVAAASLDISGNVDVDGVLETDGISIASTTITSTAAELNILDGVTASAADINLIDGITNGTVIASKAIITDANKDITGGRNITISGELDAATLDISGDADIDGTLEADAITVNGTALNTVIAGVTVANATLAATTTVTDSTANTNFPVVFHDESNALLDDTGALRYNPSTGELLVPKLTVAGVTTTADTVTMQAANAVVFEGATADAHETTLTITDPTADRTIKLPNVSGTLPILAADSNTAITSTPAELNLLDGSVANTVVNSKAVIYGSSGELASTGINFSGDSAINNTSDTAYNIRSSSGTGQHYFGANRTGFSGGVDIARLGSTGTVFNESGADLDFRIESNASANMFFVDGGNDHVCINTSTDAGGVLNIKTTGNTANLVLFSTDADANAGPILDLMRDSSSPADSDLTGQIRFRGQNDASEDINYATISSRMEDVSDGTEDGKILINTVVGGTSRSRIEIDHTDVVINQDSIDSNFRVESNGNANMLFVDGGNDKVGISTSSPESLLTIGGNANTTAKPTVQITDTSGGGSMTLRGQSPTLYFDATSSGTPTILLDGAGLDVKTGTLDSAGNLSIEHSATGNSTNFKASSLSGPAGGNGIINLKAETARSSGNGPFIGFFVPNSTGSTTTEDMGVIGFVAPDSTNASRKADFIIRTRNTSTAERFRVAANGDITATDTSIGSNSDSRLKKDITDYTYDLTKFKSYGVKKFNWKHPELHMDKTNQIGFLAQDLQNIDTQWVSQVPLTPTDEDGNAHIEAQYLDEDLLALTSKLGEKDAMYISVIQQLIERIEALEGA